MTEKWEELHLCNHPLNPENSERNCREDICPFMHQSELVLAQQIIRANIVLKWYKEEIAKIASILREQAKLALGLEFTSSFMERNVTIIYLQPVNEEGKLIFEIPKSAAWALQWLRETRKRCKFGAGRCAIDIVFDCIFIGEPEEASMEKPRFITEESLSRVSFLVEWEYEDELPENLTNKQYNAIYARSKLDGVRMFPFVTIDDHKYFIT